ncbi:X-Pro dipeptidyl-peptidase [Kribbella orskensis]|uniref:X-Pro dipeptidyl-peptidase n=1 Tax=Kribbella orskensis TaxID=2512216 RepID=A0ABY2B7T4_9ACTN|nr:MULTISPECIES: Xaa-Pro dipeptidyl-peptidase [Kribbella]TCN30562.1 X-Pro dipeptidyl-peptidase [Kribbella sp. VKM Ac-2500]TCO11295.1 X-Pro dipeptidyl-peptidase [Kribbella orskensis]
MTTVRARVTILVSSTVLCLGTATGTATAARIPDGPDAPSAAAPTVADDAAATSAAAGVPPHVDPRTRSTQPVYDYAGAIRESVYVDTTMDTDSDGADDVIAVDIVRPRETAAAGLQIPVIMDASPYYSCCGRGNESEKKTYDESGAIQKMPLYYDNYFVPRGYAVVGVDIVGTSRSTGCGDVGGKDEIDSVVAVIDWLNGRNTARTGDGQPVKATWTNGSVGMIGKSYDGTLANGVAATGVRGLKTIVPISAISSWYDYSRSGGVPYSVDYMPWLGGYVGHDTPACDAVRADLGEQDDDETGDYTAFWAERDYLKDARNVKASVFLTHGLSDYNVQTNHFAQWWDALGKNKVPRKIWLGLEDHVDPFEFRRDEWVDELHKWFDYWLQGLQNNVMREPVATVETAPDVWKNYNTWPASPKTVPVPLAAGKLGASGKGTVTVTDDPTLTEDTIVATPSDVIAGRQMFLSAPLPAAIRVSGTPTVTLRIKADSPTTPITARLVEYGQAERYSGVRRTGVETCVAPQSQYDDACYFTVQKLTEDSDHGIVSRGWIDAAHSASLSKPQPLTPGTWTTVTVPLRAQDQVIPKGRVLGLAVTLSDTEWTTPNDTGASIDIDLANSRLNLPMTVGKVAAPTKAEPIEVRITTPSERPDLHDPLR